MADKLRRVNGIPVGNTDEVMVTTGGIHALYIVCQALLEPGDEVIVPDPEWPPCVGNILAAHARPGAVSRCTSASIGASISRSWSPRSRRGRARSMSTRRSNPTGGVLTPSGLEGDQPRSASERQLWLISDEAYEDVVFDGTTHISAASLPGMYDRTIPFYTFSKSYAMTGLRLGYVAAKDPKLRERMKKVLFYTASNIASVVQYGGIGALEGSQDLDRRVPRRVAGTPRSLLRGHARACGWRFQRRAAEGGVLCVPANRSRHGGPRAARPIESISWAMTEYLISKGRIGCVPGVDFGAQGEGYIRFCFARDRRELTGALESMGALFATSPARRS